MVHVFGVSVILYFLFLFVLGCLLFLYSVHGIYTEGFQVTSGSGLGSSSLCGSGSAQSRLCVKDCTGQNDRLGSGSGSGSGSSLGTLCVPLTTDTDRLTYLQRLPMAWRQRARLYQHMISIRCTRTRAATDQTRMHQVLRPGGNQ